MNSAIRAACGLVLLIAVWVAHAADSGDPPTRHSVAELREHLAAAEAVEGPGIADRIAFLRELIDHAEAAEAWNAQREASAARLEAAPALIADLSRQISGRHPSSLPARVEAADEDQLRQLVANLRSTQVRLQTERAELEGELRDLELRPGRLADQLNEVRTELAALQGALGGAAADGPSAEIRRARAQALNAQIAALEQETAGLPVRADELEVRVAAANHQLEGVTHDLTIVQGLLTDGMQRNAAKLLAEVEADFASSATRTDAMRANIETAEELVRLTRTYQLDVRELSALSGEADRLRTALEQTRQRIENVTLTPLLGELLRAQLRQLPGTESFQRATVELEERQRALSLRRLEIQTQLRELEEADATESFGQRRELLHTIDQMAGQSMGLLAELEAEHRAILAAAQATADYLNGNLLWLPDVEVVSLADLRALPTGLIEAVAAPSLQGGNRSDWVTFVLGLLIVIGLAILRPSLAQRLEVYADATRSVRTDRLRNTLAAVVITCLLAAPVPLFAWIAAQLLAATPQPESQSAAAALTAVGRVTLPGFLILELARPNGVAERHFRWRPELLALLRRWARFWLPLGVVGWFLVEGSGGVFGASWQSSVGRLGFALVLVPATMAAAWGLLNPKAWNSAIADGEPAPWGRLAQPVWFWIAQAVPLSLGILALSGYVYTATQLALRVEATLAAILGVFVVRHLMLRWLRVEQRRMAFAARIDRMTREEHEEAAHREEPEVSLDEISGQTRYVVTAFANLGLLISAWMIWQDILPALSMLSQIELWGSDAAAGAFTLQSLLEVGILTFLLAIAARNIPGVLEILVLQRLPIDHGTRYAIISVSQYAIIIGGTIAVTSALGLQWSNVQWLVAALSVGLGFGLQEIVANFVSGIILLFERPIRIGDTVTIGNLSGTVARIRIRATTLIDWDNREIVVPNKNFLTEQLTNWTLTDPVTRVVIPVGVAYGSDVEQVKQILAGCIEANENVLNDPPSTVLFLALGDSSLNFEVRVYVATPDLRLPVTSALLQAFSVALEDAGITIPFPQRDVHLKVDDTDVDAVRRALVDGGQTPQA